MSTDDPTRHARFRIADMDCPTEEGQIRRALAPFPGIRSLGFSLSERTLSIDAPAALLPQALAAIRAAGFEPEQIAHTPADNSAPAGIWGSQEVRRYALALMLAIGAETLAFLAPPTPGFKAAGMAIAALAIALAGLSTYRKGWKALREARLNINALMSVAVTGAFLIGQWPEAAMVMALYAIAELIEAHASDRARQAISKLLELAPDTAELAAADGSWTSMPVAEVPIGARVRIKPGARVPLDGTVAAGTSAIDQSALTGESIPVDKTVGDTVFAGTINAFGTLEVRIDTAATDSTLARIIRAVENAQASRGPTQQFVDRFAAIYTPAVFGIAIAVALLGPWLAGWTWSAAAYQALVILVIACPCALVIATPVTVVSGLASAARRGILIKGGAHLEGARRIRLVALDKTGTVTEGQARLVASMVLANPLSSSADSASGALKTPEASATAETKVTTSIGMSDATVKELAWALAEQSDHPVSRAIASGLVAQGGQRDQSKVSAITALAGRGVQARVDGRRYVLGNRRLIEELGLAHAGIEARLAEHEQQGHTVTMLASDHEILAIFAVADTIKVSSLRGAGRAAVARAEDCNADR